MNIEKLLKEISLGQNKIYKFYPQSTSWRFLIQKNKLKTEKGTFFYFFVVAFSLQLHKTKEVKCKTIKELRVFIKEMLRKGEQAGADWYSFFQSKTISPKHTINEANVKQKHLFEKRKQGKIPV